MVCMSNESETNSVFNWKGVCISERLQENKDIQRSPHFSHEWIEPLSAAKVQHHIQYV